MSLRIVAAPSPNHRARRPGQVIDTIVLHACGGSDDGTREWCSFTKEELAAIWERTPANKRPPKPWGPVSYHDHIGRDGSIAEMVDPKRVAYSCGSSSFMGKPSVNEFSLSLAFGSLDNGTPLMQVQLEAAALRCVYWMHRYPEITLARITTHRVVSPGRKVDPKPPFCLTSFHSMVAERMACTI